MLNQIVNIKYGFMRGVDIDHYEKWTNRLGVCVAVLIAIGIVYLEARLNHWVGL